MPRHRRSPAISGNPLAPAAGHHRRSGAVIGSSLMSGRDFLLVDDELRARLARQRDDAKCRAIDLLAVLDADLAELGLKAALNAGGLVHRGLNFDPGSGGGKPLGDRLGMDANKDVERRLKRFLKKIWKRVEKKLANHPTVQKIARVLGHGIEITLRWLRSLVLSRELIKFVVPFYAPVRAAIDAVEGAWATHGHSKVWESLQTTADKVADGYPRIAIEAFAGFVNEQKRIAAAGTAYAFVKSLAVTLATIFTAGAASVIGMVTAVVDAVVSFSYNMVQAVFFKEATNFARQSQESNSLPSDEEFRIIFGCAPFAACALFAGANIMGHANLAAALSGEQRIISAASLQASIAQIGAAQKAACGYVRAVGFPIKCTDPEAKWVLKMMRGYADAPRSEFLTQNASRAAKARHAVRGARQRLGV